MKEILKSDLINKVNIVLYNNIISFITEITDKELIAENFKKRCCKYLLYDKDIYFDLECFKEKYNIRYIGELLERYEERGLNNIRDLRAIALGIADTVEIQNQLMFVGNQLKDFISEIRNKYQKEFDIYLATALFKLTSDINEKGKVLKEILEYDYINTEDIIVMLTVNINDSLKSNIYNLIKEQLSSLLGLKRNLPIYKNEAVFAFVISELYDIIKADKKKNASFLREFCNLYIKNIIGSSILKENGYSNKEMLYLNYYIPNCIYDYRNINVSLKKLVYEKIAVNYFIYSITDENLLSQYEKEYLEALLYKYRNFEIKCYGYSDIKSYLKDLDIEIRNNDTYIWFLNLDAQISPSQESKIFKFDILDEQKNEIIVKMNTEQRIDYINNLIINTDIQEKEKIISVINKVKELCTFDYIENITINGCNNVVAFSKLVDMKIINLNDYINQQEKISYKLINNIRIYISGIHTIPAYNYINLFIEKYGMIKLIEVFGKNVISDLTRYNHDYYNKVLNIEFNNFNKQQIRNIIYWFIEYAYYFDTENMCKYVFWILKNSNIINYFSKQELHDVYVLYKENLIKDYKCYDLDKLYLYDEELEQINKEKMLKTQANILKSKSEYFINTLKKFKADFDGTFKSIADFIEANTKYLSTNNDKRSIIYDFIYNVTINFKSMYKNYSQDELGYLIKLYSAFLIENYISEDEFFEAINDVKKGGVKND